MSGSNNQSYDVTPWTGPCNFTFGLPGSKSLTLRDCAMAALAGGRSVIAYPGECDDYTHMRACLQRLAVPLEESEDAIAVTGNGGRFSPGAVELYTGQSAVTTRLLLAVACLRTDPTHFDAHISMQTRPNGPLVDALRALGATIECERDGYLPLVVRGPARLGSRVSLKADISSQYLSALLLIAPLLEEGLEIEIIGDLASKPYVDLTFDEMRKFGVQVEHDNYQRLRVAPGGYRATHVRVEGDASAASYWAALATLHRGHVSVENLGSSTRQGDYGFFALCEQLGARVERTRETTKIWGPPGPLGRFFAPVDMALMPDVAPTLMVMAPFLAGTTRIEGLATLRVKECDRIAAPATELRKLGVSLREGPDWIEIDGLPEEAQRKLHSEAQRQARVEIATYHDHRIGMCFGVLGTLLPGVTILDPGCVGKTYPRFWADLERAGATITAR
jgi:3-phosphoshikimate 1-carboxyvinyltransferase